MSKQQTTATAPALVTFELLPELTNQQIDGVDYLVAPAVIVVEGVLNSELILGDEIAAYVGAWDGSPIVINHPKDSKGNHTSANSDPYLPRYGWLFNAAWDETNRRLRGELWINEAKLKNTPHSAILDKIHDGQIVELSSAFYRDIDPRPGTFNGKPYNGISRNLRPDHVALLPNDIGACSVIDGCGVPRVNAAHDDLDFSQSVMIALYPSPGAAAEMTLTAEQSAGAVSVLPPNELHITLAYIGQIDRISMTESQLLEALAMFARYTPIIYADVQGGGYFDPMKEAAAIPYFGLITSPQISDIRRDLVDWTLYDVSVSNRHLYQPHMTLCYYPPGLDRLDVPIVKRRSLAFDAISLSWGGRITHFKLQGEIPTEATGPASLLSILANINQKDGLDMSGQNTQNDEILAGITALTTKIEALGGKITDMETAVTNQGNRLEAVETIAANIVNEEAAQKQTLVTQLAAAQACPLNETALTKLDLAELQTLAANYMAASYEETDYMARSGVAANSEDGWEDYQE